MLFLFFYHLNGDNTLPLVYFNVYRIFSLFSLPMIFLVKKFVWIFFIIFLTIKDKPARILKKMTLKNLTATRRKTIRFFFVSGLK